jgi:hypothetical protein
MEQADARAAIFNATVEMLKLNEKVGNALPKEIVQCVDGEAKVSSDNQIIAFMDSMYKGQLPAGRTTILTETAAGVPPTTVTMTAGTSTASQSGGGRRTRRHRSVRHKAPRRKTQIRRHK